MRLWAGWSSIVSGRADTKASASWMRSRAGVCAGAYLATCDYEWSLGVLDAKVVDRTKEKSPTATPRRWAWVRLTTQPPSLDLRGYGIHH